MYDSSGRPGGTGEGLDGMAGFGGGHSFDPEHAPSHVGITAEGEHFRLRLVCRCGRVRDIADLDWASATATVVSLIALSTPEALYAGIAAAGDVSQGRDSDWGGML